MIVSIVGRKKSGKTTLIENLVPELIKGGYKVATVKHDVHGFEIDTPDKDSYRHRKAGANPVIISSPDKIAFIKRVEKELTLAKIAQKYLEGVDLVLAEGFKKENFPQIEVLRQEISKEPISSPQKLLAIVADFPYRGKILSFNFKDIKGITNFLEKNILKKEGYGS